jgi:hypothetical protein
MRERRKQTGTGIGIHSLPVRGCQEVADILKATGHPAFANLDRKSVSVVERRAMKKMRRALNDLEGLEAHLWNDGKWSIDDDD